MVSLKHVEINKTEVFETNPLLNHVQPSRGKKKDPQQKDLSKQSEE